MPDLSNFTWFDKPMTAEQPHSLGALSKIGRTLSNVAAPFGAAYGNDFGIRQMQLQAQQDQADMEFQKYLNQLKGSEPQSPEEVKKYIEALTGGSGGNLPPGTNIKINTPAGDITMPLNREYTQGETKDLTSAESIRGQIGEMKKILNSPGAFKSQFMGALPFGGFSPEGQNFAVIKKDVSDRLLRLRSGAAINEQEYKRFVDLLATFWRNDKVDLKQLDVFEKEFSNIEGRIASGALWDKKKGEFIGGQANQPQGNASGGLDPELLKELKRRGLI